MTGAVGARHFGGKFGQLVEVCVFEEMVGLADFGEEGWHGVKIRIGNVSNRLRSVNKNPIGDWGEIVYLAAAVLGHMNSCVLAINYKLENQQVMKYSRICRCCGCVVRNPIPVFMLVGDQVEEVKWRCPLGHWNDYY